MLKKQKSEFIKNKPFPNIIIKNLFNEDYLQQIINEMPNINDDKSKFYKGQYGNLKKQTIGEGQLKEKSKKFFHYLNSDEFLTFLENITGIKNLLPDPKFVGGGFHQIMKGGFLKVHADFIKHNKYNFYRRLNLIIYLNHDWKDKWGGHLELWNSDMSKLEKKIPPVFNHTVLFNTTSKSYHGHPEPLNTPSNVIRKSIAIYYYTIEKPSESDLLNEGDHGTLYQSRHSLDNFKKFFFI